MKGCKKALSLLISVAALTSISSCGEPVTSKENILLSYKNNEGVSVDFTTDDLLLNYFDSQLSTSNQQLYDIVYEALVKKYFSLESNQTAYQEIKTNAENEIRRQKNNAEENAVTNQTKYEEEWEKILDTELSDIREDKRTEELLREKYEYDYMKTKIADEFYDKFKSWEDINNIEDVAERELQQEYNIFSGDNGYLEKRLPYHVRHILVKVDADSNALYNGQISSSDATSIYNVVDALSKGTSFGTVAEDHSEDSSESYGNLGIMDKATSFVNEFKLSIYIYDMLFNNNESVKSSLALDSDPFNMMPDEDTTYFDYFEDLGIARIPVQAVENLYKYSEVTETNDGKELNDGNASYYPRNIIFNKYFNNHNFGFITLEDIKTPSLTELEGNAHTGNNGTTYYSDLNAEGKWETAPYTGSLQAGAIGDHKSGFKSIQLRNGESLTVLCDENDNPIIVVRAGTSDYQGIHFITVERSALETTKTYTYYDQTGANKGTYESTLNEYYAAISPINLNGTLNSEFPQFTTTDGQTSAKKSYINYIVSDYNGYADRADTLKNTIKDFNPSYNNYVYLWLKQTIDESEPTVLVNIGDTQIDVTTRINKYVYQQIEKNKSSFEISEDTWKDYYQYLINQADERETKLIPESCALGFLTGEGYEEGGICRYVKSN